MSWRKSFNISGRPQGTNRSITGYGAESLIIGRALLCGYNLFFKAWRDSKYDAVLEADKILFRLEFKGTSTESLTLTSGGRSGKQIKKTAASREKVLSTEDSEILIGIDSACGVCWVIPTEVVKVLGKRQIATRHIDFFREKWGVLNYLATSPNLCRKILAHGILGLTDSEHEELIIAYGNGKAPGHDVNPFQIGTRIFTGKIKKTLNLWKLIYDQSG